MQRDEHRHLSRFYGKEKGPCFRRVLADISIDRMILARKRRDESVRVYVNDYDNGVPRWSG